MASAAVLSSIQVIDTDTHLSEPADLWTSRVPAKWVDEVPHVAIHPETGQRHWKIGDTWLASTGFFAQAGSDVYPNDALHRNLEDSDPGSWNATDRLQRMDEYGIYAQVLYPNVIGFEAPLIAELGPELSLACTRAYNDFLVEFSAADPKRFIPIAMVPFWDVDGSVAEIRRAREQGHKGVLFANKYERIGLPAFTDEHWDPIYAVCQDLEMSINFHVGFSGMRTGTHTAKGKIDRAKNFNAGEQARATSVGIMTNGDSIAAIVTSGLCDRFPRLKFVSVESGFGYLTYLMESLDWHWKGYGGHRNGGMLPSDYFRRQCYGTFWFERLTLPLLATFPDNFMFETDYPHPTAMAPGKASPADRPGDHILSAFADVPDDVARKALHDNAAAVYGI
ncbi:MAG: amidohydrolase family protein [Acidimicrobiia bacterium]